MNGSPSLGILDLRLLPEPLDLRTLEPRGWATWIFPDLELSSPIFQSGTIMFGSSLRVLVSTSVLFGTLGSTQLAAQSSGDVLQREFPELGALFNAFDVTQGAFYQQLVAIGESSGSEEAQDRLRETLTMQTNMTMLDMMQMSFPATWKGWPWVRSGRSRPER